MSITHEIYKSFDKVREVKGVFFDISKAFDKVWHEDIVFKLTRNRISGNLIKPLRDILRKRRQRVALSGQVSTWTNVIVEVPQGFILGLLLLLFYINDLSEGLSTNVKLFADDASLLFADDTSLFSVIHDS